MSNRGWVAAGRLWRATLTARAPERRAVSWFGIGPAREDKVGRIRADMGPGLTDPTGTVVGVAVHAGPRLLVLSWQPAGIRRPTVGTSRPPARHTS